MIDSSSEILHLITLTTTSDLVTCLKQQTIGFVNGCSVFFWQLTLAQQKSGVGAEGAHFLNGLCKSRARRHLPDKSPFLGEKQWGP